MLNLLFFYANLSASTPAQILGHTCYFFFTLLKFIAIPSYIPFLRGKINFFYIQISIPTPIKGSVFLLS